MRILGSYNANNTLQAKVRRVSLRVHASAVLSVQSRVQSGHQ